MPRSLMGGVITGIVKPEIRNVLKVGWTVVRGSRDVQRNWRQRVLRVNQEDPVRK
jgi:hypothetical protein